MRTKSDLAHLKSRSRLIDVLTLEKNDQKSRRTRDLNLDLIFPREALYTRKTSAAAMRDAKVSSSFEESNLSEIHLGGPNVKAFRFGQSKGE